jgi:hypothetical protein
LPGWQNRRLVEVSPSELKAHLLRQACGNAQANKGPAKQGWLRHRSITSTALASARLKDFWWD